MTKFKCTAFYNTMNATCDKCVIQIRENLSFKSYISIQWYAYLQKQGNWASMARNRYTSTLHNEIVHDI